MDFRLTYPDYAALMGDRRPKKHSPTRPVRPPRNARDTRR